MNTIRVVGFVPIFAAVGGYRHLHGQTLRMRWPGTAEEWLDALVRPGLYARWRRASPGNGEPEEYRGARVFRCSPAAPPPGSDPAGQLVAVWEAGA